MDHLQGSFRFLPAGGAACNLRCSYCYYLSRKERYPTEPFPRMKEVLLEEYIRQHIDATTDDTVFFSWHGGEPTLAGLEFYRKAVDLQKRMLPQGSGWSTGCRPMPLYSMMRGAGFCQESVFLVGVSLDGPAQIHDLYRQTADGKAVSRLPSTDTACCRNTG
jgi:uncharacterized protein